MTDSLPPVVADASPIPSQPMAPSPELPLEVDTPCRKCSYNLRGLLPANRCPECGTPVGVSTYGNLLRYSDPAWLNQLTRGVTFMLWGMVVALVVGVLSAIITRITSSLVIGHILGLIGALLGLAGVWLLTEPDPSGLGEDRYGTIRKFMRICLLLNVANHFLLIFSAINTSHTLAFSIQVAQLVIGLIGLAGEFAKYLYLERIALRVPDDGLARSARVVRWGMTICLSAITLSAGIVVVYALSAGPAVAGPRSSGGGLVVLGCIGGLFGLGMLVFLILTIRLLLRMRTAFKQSAEVAQQIWQAAPPTV